MIYDTSKFHIKRILALLILCVILAGTLFLLCSCGRSKSSDSTKSQNGNNPDHGKASHNQLAVYKSDGVIDLTKMSATLVYAEVYNMMNSPEDYIGREIIIEGQYMYVNEDGKDYFACIVKDATACCAQGIEFILGNGKTYPDDYPEDGSQVKVRGIFQIYEENGYKLCHLVDAELL